MQVCTHPFREEKKLKVRSIMKNREEKKKDHREEEEWQLFFLTVFFKAQREAIITLFL